MYQFHREYYKMLEYADVVGCVETLVMLKKKRIVDWTKLLRDLISHVDDFR